MPLFKGSLLSTKRPEKSGKRKKSSSSKPEGLNYEIPIKSIGDLIQTSDKRYKIIGKVSPVNAELLSEDDLEAVYESIQGALNSFDGRIGIYIQSEKINIESNIEAIEEYKNELNTEIEIEWLDDQAKFLESMTNKSRNVLNFYISLESKQSKYEIAKQLLEDAMYSVQAELGSEDMFVTILKEKEILRLLYERLNPETSIVEPFQDEWELFDISPKQMVIDANDPKVLENDGRYYRFFSIDTFPLEVKNFRWLKRIFEINGDINVSFTLTPKNKETITRELSNAARELGSKALETNRPLHEQKKYEREKQTAELLIDELGNANTVLFDVNVTIGISEKEKEKLNTTVTTLRSRIASARCSSVELKHKGFDPFWTTLPIIADNKITQDYVWNLTGSDVASLILFDSSELMERRGILQGENVTSKGLVVVDPFNKKIHTNPHMAIIAYSGSGKSFYISADAMRHYPYRDYTILFDIEGEFFFPYGKRYRFSSMSPYVSNPFHIRNAVIDSDGQDDGEVNIGSYLGQKIMDTITFFKWIYPEMTSYDESLLEIAIRNCYKEVQLTFESTELPELFPTLTTLEIVLEKMIEENKSAKESEHLINMKAVFNPYINGSYAAMFNGQTNWEIDKMTVFDISQVSDAVRKPLYDILLKDVWQFCKVDRSKTKRIYADEAHEFADIKRPQTLEFLSTLVKRGRKYGLSLVTATQNLPDFLSIPKYGQAIIDNSYFKLFMALGETDLPVAQNLYNFSDREMKILKQKKRDKQGKGKGIFFAGSQRVEIQTRASIQEMEVIDPDQYESLENKPSKYRRVFKSNESL